MDWYSNPAYFYQNPAYVPSCLPKNFLDYSLEEDEIRGEDLSASIPEGRVVHQRDSYARSEKCVEVQDSGINLTAKVRTGNAIEEESFEKSTGGKKYVEKAKKSRNIEGSNRGRGSETEIDPCECSVDLECVRDTNNNVLNYVLEYEAEQNARPLGVKEATEIQIYDEESKEHSRMSGDGNYIYPSSESGSKMGDEDCVRNSKKNATPGTRLYENRNDAAEAKSPHEMESHVDASKEKSSPTGSQKEDNSIDRGSLMTNEESLEEYLVYKVRAKGRTVYHIFPACDEKACSGPEVNSVDVWEKIEPGEIDNFLECGEKSVDVESHGYGPVIKLFSHIHNKPDSPPDPPPKKKCVKKRPSKKVTPITRRPEFPCKCNVCPDQVFKYRSGLSRHMRVVHKMEKYICPVCEKKYTRKDSINGHIKNFHVGISTNLKIAALQSKMMGEEERNQSRNTRKKQKPYATPREVKIEKPGKVHVRTRTRKRRNDSENGEITDNATNAPNNLKALCSRN